MQSVHTHTLYSVPNNDNCQHMARNSPCFQHTPLLLVSLVLSYTLDHSSIAYAAAQVSWKRDVIADRREIGKFTYGFYMVAEPCADRMACESGCGDRIAELVLKLMRSEKEHMEFPGQRSCRQTSPRNCVGT